MDTFHLNIPVWEDQAWTPLASLEADLTADVCVVGLGGSGLACVLELLELGLDVIGLDAGSVAGGAAGRNGGFVLGGTARFYHETVGQFGRECAKAMYALTLEQLDRMTAETPSAIRRVGSLRIADSKDELADCERQLEAMRADGFAVEHYDGADGRGLLFPLDGALQPLARCRTLAQDALESGARLFESSPALEIKSGSVRTPSGTVSCKHVIVAVDGQLEVIFPELVGRVRTARLQMIASAPTTEITVSRPVYARWGYEYWQQLPDGRVTLGGFRDRALAEEWTLEKTPTERVQNLLEMFMRGRIGVHAPITHRWAANVAYSNDGMPVIEEVRPNVWAIGAYNGTGNIVGALCGRAVAQLVVTGSSSIAEVLKGGQESKGSQESGVKGQE